MVNEDVLIFEEYIKHNNKKYVMKIEAYTSEITMTSYILTIYEVKRVIFKTKKIQVLRTVACDTEDANLSALVELGRHYITTF